MLMHELSPLFLNVTDNLTNYKRYNCAVASNTVLSSDIDRIVYIVHKYDFQTSGSCSEVRLPWHNRWCHFNGVVVSPSASRPDDTDRGSSFSKLIKGCHDSTWSSWSVFN